MAFQHIYYNAVTTFLEDLVALGMGEKPALYYQDSVISYAELLGTVNRTAGALRELGVEMENRLMIVLPDCPEFVCSFFGALKIGAVAVPVGTLSKAPEYAYVLNDSRAKVAIVHHTLLPEMEKALSDSIYPEKLVVVGGDSRYYSYERLISNAREVVSPAPTTRDDMAFWFYTSGSTGPPKGVVHLHHDMKCCADTVGKEVFAFTQEDVSFSASKLFFAYGLGNSLFFPMRVGASTVLCPERMTPEIAFRMIHRYRPTKFFAVPTLYGRMLQVEGAEREYDLSSVSMFVSSGESLPPSIFHAWREKFGQEILDVIGSTECLAQFIASRPGKVKSGSCGTGIAGIDLKLTDDDGNLVANGVPGHLWITAESNSPFYWNRHEASKRSMVGEWLRTGDILYRDEDGFYWYCGRTDDMLKVGGCWVSPAEVENTLMEHPAVLEAAIVGDQDADGLVKPKAYVALKEQALPTPQLAEELKGFVKGKLAPFKYPRWVEFVPELPKTATGKIQRFRLRAG